MNKRYAVGSSVSVGAVVLAIACSPDQAVTPDSGPGGFAETGIALDVIPRGQSIPFTALATSASCIAGGRGGQQIVLPPGYIYSVIGREGPGIPDLTDMNTVNESGPQPGRYLYRTHETGVNAGVSETDLETGVSRIVAQRADWGRFDGIAWTPWHTIIAAEEQSDGLVWELDPATGAAVARPAVGVRAHEGLRFDQDGNLYGISETNPGYVYRFVPDEKGDLSSGQLYALRITQDLGDRTGVGEWVALDRAAVQVNSLAEATARGATGYSRPEDVEIGTSTGDDKRGNHIMYVAITGEDRVVAIDLKPQSTVGGDVTVSDYVRDGLNAPSDFDAPDNLALDRSGNLYITEDPGGSAPGKTLGDDVWFAPHNPQSGMQSLPIQRFFSITDCNAEPSGVYMSISNRTLFVNLQHRGGDGVDLAVAIQRMADVSFDIAGRR